MPELEPQNQVADRSTDASEDASADPMASLHKMSMTAGVGSQEYVAINNLAVASAVLALCTALGFLGPPFLIVALAGISCGIVALRQIGNSNGTQSGKSMAWIGIVVSLAMAGSVIAFNTMELVRQREDEKLINAQIDQLSNYIVAGDYVKAYAMFDTDFRNEWTIQKFEQRWKELESFNGKVEKLEGGKGFEFRTTGGGVPEAYTFLYAKFAKLNDPWQKTIGFRKHDAQWDIHGYELMQKPREKP